MSEPRRLIDEAPDEVEAALLRSARWDAPPPNSRRKALVALGVGAAATTATTSVAAAVTASSAGTIYAWIGGGIAAGLLAVGVSVAVSMGDPAAPTHPVPAVAMGDPAAPTHPVPAVAMGDPERVPAVAMGDPERVPQTPPVVAKGTPPAADLAAGETASAAPAKVDAASSARVPERAPATSSLADEVAAIDAARVALASGDAAGARRALDDHDRRFPRGAMGPEATVLRIEALNLAGDRAAARSLATSYLAAHPTSPHASRLRTLLGL